MADHDYDIWLAPSAGEAQASPTSGAPRAFHRRLPGYRPTPLRSAPGIARRLGVAEVRVKDESSRFGLPAYKILGASWAIHRELTASLDGPNGGRSLEEAQSALPGDTDTRFSS